MELKQIRRTYCTGWVVSQEALIFFLVENCRYGGLQRTSGALTSM